MKEEGCRRCGTLGLKLRRMLEEGGGCRSTNCHIREFIEFAAMLIRRHHRCDSSFFERIGATPKSVAFDCAGDILRDGQYPFDEVVCFFARHFQVIAGVPLVARVATYKIIVRSMILGTIIRMREIEDDWARKIRGGIEQALWKHPRLGSMEHGDKTFHYNRDRGEPRPMPEGPQEPEDLLPDIRLTLKERDERRKAPEEHRKGRRRRKRAESDPFHAILEAIFIVLAKRDGFNPALTVSTLTVIVIRWYESKLVAEYGEPAEDKPDPLDDSMILALEATLKFLRRGRMDGLTPPVTGAMRFRNGTQGLARSGNKNASRKSSGWQGNTWKN